MRFFSHVAGTLIALALLLSTSPALAATKDAKWGFELRLGGYRPAMGDGTIPGTSVTERQYYKMTFGNGRPVMLQLEFDRYLRRFFGNLGVFVQVGNWKTSGKARSCTDISGASGTCTAQDIAEGRSTKAKDKTQLQIIPFSFGVVYRVDWLQKELNVPLVGYAKLGFDYFYWWFTEGKASGLSGGTPGLHLAVGLSLSLAWIATHPENPVFLDSFFFAEYSQIWADGFGNKKKFDMSAGQWVFGLSFEFG